jgi:hypothetical protein
MSRFGRAEARGRRHRHVFDAALASGRSVVTAVRPPFDQEWASFAIGMAADLAVRFADIVDWARHQMVASIDCGASHFTGADR